MPRNSRDRRGRSPLTREQRKALIERAKIMKKRTRRKATTKEKIQIGFVVLVIGGIILIAIRLAGYG